MAKIQIGPASAREYLEQQVAPAYSRFLDVPSQENALSAAATLWDTRGWIDQKASPAAAKALSEDLLARCPDLGLIHDLADAAKHSGELDRSSVLVKGISGSGSPGGATFTSSPLGTFQSTPECTLQIDLKNGGHRDMKEALATVYKFLRAECPDWVFSMGARFPGLRKAIGESRPGFHRRRGLKFNERGALKAVGCLPASGTLGWQSIGLTSLGTTGISFDLSR